MLIRKPLRLLCLLMAFLLLPFPPPGHAEEAAPQLTVYEGPKTMTSSADCSVSVCGVELFVYDVMVNHEHIWNANTVPATTPMTYFDFSGTVTVEVRMPGLPHPVESAQVLPSSAGVVAEVRDGAVCFTLSSPGQYTVVFNGDVNKALHLFANPPETDLPDPADPNVFWIGPGEWVMDAISLTDHQTLYLSGGAVLHSIISVANAEDVRICGRGIIDGSDYPAWNQPGSLARVPIDLNHSKDVRVEGISLVNSNCWNFNSFSSRNVRIDNVKIISGRQNGDGFTFQSCTDHLVTRSFARTWDDSLVIKNYSGSTRGITFRDMQVWTDLAQSMEIGYETDKGLTLDPEICDVLFENITVLYNFHKPVISIHNSDDAAVHDITWRNITVENAMMQGDNGFNRELIEMTLQNSAWSTVRDEFGTIDHVLIDGLTVEKTADGKVPPSRFSGHDGDHQITDVVLRNIRILNQDITDLKAMRLSTDEFCGGIVIEPPVAGAKTAETVDPLLSTSPHEDPAVTVIAAPEQTGAQRPPCFPDPTDNYIPLPETENYALAKPVISGAHTDVYRDVNVNDSKTDTYWESKGFPAEITFDLEKTCTVSTVAVCLNPSSIWEPRIQEIAVLVSTDGISYTEVVPAEKYSFDAATGNRIRIDFDPADAAFVRLVFTMNSSSRTGGAQAAEICVY